MIVIFLEKMAHYKKEPSKISKTRPHNILMKLPGIVGQKASNAKTEIECLFFTEHIFNLLVQHTNEYIEDVRKKFARGRNCRLTNKAEIKAFLGLVYLEEAINDLAISGTLMV